MPHKAGFLLTLVALFTFSLVALHSSWGFDFLTGLLLTRHKEAVDKQIDLLGPTTSNRRYRWKDRIFTIEWFRRIYKVNDAFIVYPFNNGHEAIQRISTAGSSISTHPIIKPADTVRRDSGPFGIFKSIIKGVGSPKTRRPVFPTVQASPPSPKITRRPAATPSPQKPSKPNSPLLTVDTPALHPAATSLSSTKSPASSIVLSPSMSYRTIIKTQSETQTTPPSRPQTSTVITTATMTANSKSLNKNLNFTLALAIGFGVLAFLMLVAGVTFLIRRRMKKRRLLDEENSSLYRTEYTADLDFLTSRGSTPSLRETFWRRESLKSSNIRGNLQRYSY